MTETSSQEQSRQVVKAISKRSYATLATTSPKGRPHVAGVLYAAVGSTLYVSTSLGSRKAKNIVDNPHVAVTIPIRRLPVGPPSAVQFQGTAEILAVDDPEVVRLHEAGRLKNITSHGELDLPDGCIVRITPPHRVITYGLGMSLLQVMRDPLNLEGRVELPA